MKSKKYKLSIVLMLLVGFIFCNSRVAFTRLGSMIRIPTGTSKPITKLFTVGGSTQIYNFSPRNQGSGIFLNTYFSPKLQFGISSITYADTSAYINEIDFEVDNQLAQIDLFESVSETGIHFQYNVFTKDDISIDIGLQDILFRKGEKINQNSMSFYAVFASNRKIDEYSLGSYLGFGTGKISKDTGIIGEKTKTSQAAGQGIFLGFLLSTPYMKEQGGVDFMAEYDGGLNVGLKIPITDNYRLLLAANHIEKLGEFGIQSDPLEARELAVDDPSISIGFSMSIPGGFNGTSPTFKTINIESSEKINDNKILPTNDLIDQLRDSLKYSNFQIKNLSEHNAQMDQQLNQLIDSTRTMHLTKQIYKSNLNKTMRHLSRSLRYYYDAEYVAALQEIEQAIQVNPDLAAAYARRGAIYFKLGEQQKAIINWNLALKLDPEYDEVRKVLEAVRDKRLESATNLNNPGGL